MDLQKKLSSLNMNILQVCVTGANGFIGKRLVEALSRQGYSIRVLTRRLDCVLPNAVEVVIGDLTLSTCKIDQFLLGCDLIFHCAAEIANEDIMHELHINGTQRLLEEVSNQIKLTHKPIRWVQLSSVGVYGPSTGMVSEFRVVTESTVSSPKGEYEVTKTVADELIMQLAAIEPLFSYTILRPSNVIGESMPNQSLRSLVSMIRKRLFFYINSRSAVATYIHVDDVVAALMLCGTDLRAIGQVFNLSNDCKLSEIVSAVAKSSGVKPPNLCVPEMPLRILVKLLSPILHIPLTQERIDALVRGTYYPATKIKDFLGFVPQYNIPSVAASIFKEKLNAK